MYSSSSAPAASCALFAPRSSLKTHAYSVWWGTGVAVAGREIQDGGGV